MDIIGYAIGIVSIVVTVFFGVRRLNSTRTKAAKRTTPNNPQLAKRAAPRMSMPSKIAPPKGVPSNAVPAREFLQLLRNEVEYRERLVSEFEAKLRNPLQTLQGIHPRARHRIMESLHQRHSAACDELVIARSKLEIVESEISAARASWVSVKDGIRKYHSDNENDLNNIIN